MRLHLATLLFFACVSVGHGQAADTSAPVGYVVRIESGSVYLDLGEKTGAHVGQPFTIYTEGDELKHPVTKESLGRLETTIAEGALSLVLPLYSVGSVRPGGSEVKAGMRAKLVSRPAPPPAVPPAAAPDGKDGVASRLPRVKGPALDYAVTGMAIADFRGEGKPTLAASDNKTVSLYAYPMQSAQPLAQFVLQGVGPRIVSLSAADLDGNGKAELFATFYNETFTRMETAVLEWSDGQWKRLADLSWMVRGYQASAGKPVLAMQQLVEDQTFPFSNIYPVVYSDGRYTHGKDALRFKRVDFLFDFTQANVDGSREPALLYQTSTNHVRVQFQDGFWKTPEAYGQTPSRLRWHARLLEFHPQMPVAVSNGKAAVFLIKNISALGSLSEPFGLFNDGRIERQEWNGVALAPAWRADLGGYCAAAQLVPDPAAPTDLAVAVTGTAGKSAIWIYDP